VTHRLKNTLRSSLFLFSLVCLSLLARAQGYGVLNGTVTDSTGAVVSNATIVASQASTGLAVKTTTSAEGAYVFPTLPPSVYNLSVKQAGFQAYYEKGVQLQANASRTINIVLKAGSTDETVTVNAEVVQVDTTSGTLEQVIGSAQVNDLPLNGRNAAALTAEVAGVAVAPSAQADQGSTKTFPMAFTITANGTRVGQTNYLLDGGNNVDEYTNVNAPFPMPDALQEFSVQTSNYDASYGQNAGGVVNIITKGGTSKYHGDLFEFVRNRYFNAANYFSYVNGVKTVDPLKRNQFGGTVGGPVNIPHLFKSDKAFFFVGYQKTINRTMAVSATSSQLPTTAQLAGTFTGESKCLTDPMNSAAILSCTQTGSTYTTVIDTNYYSTASKALLNYLPSSSQLNANGTLSYQKPSFYNLGEWTARYDQELTPRDRLVVRYFNDDYHLDGVLNPKNLLTYADEANIKYYNSLISETHTFNDHLLNSLALSYQIDNASRGALAGSISVADLGVNIWQPAFKQINSIAVSNYFTVGDNPQGFFRRSNYTLNDDLHWQKAAHNFAFGFHGEISKVDVDNLYRQPGVFTFNANNTGDGIASFLLGYVYQFQQASGQFFNARGTFVGFYAQDSWKLNRRLTLNYGVRYEPFKPWHEKMGRMGSFFPSLYAQGTHSVKYPNAPAGLLFAGDTGFNPNGVSSAYNHFMPRLGFAWDVFGTGKTSIRGGTGMFFDSRISSVLFNIYSNASPFITNVDISNAGGTSIKFTDPYGSYGLTNPFPATQPPAATTNFPTQSYLTYDPFNGFKDPTFYSWNLALEQQLTSSVSARVAYVASHGSHQWVPVELNPFVSGTRVYNPTGCSASNSCFTQAITAANTGANTSYNSLQASLEQRMRYGLTLTLNYTWSKALDNMPFNAAATSIGAGNSYVMPITVAGYKALDYGPSDFDHRNVVSMSYVYSLPKVGASMPALTRYALNGWDTSGLFQFRSGDPLTAVSSSSNNSGSGQQRDRAVWNGSNAYGGSACSAGTHCKSYLNPANFANNGSGAYGNIKKGSFVGPQYAGWDVSAGRKFPIRQSTYMQFRAEYFNVLNHTNFGDPTTTNNSSFGRITSTAPQNSNYTNDPRIAQFSLKLVF